MDIHEYLKMNVTNGIITESIRNRDIERAIKLMQSYLLKRGVYPYNFVLPLEKDGKKSIGILAWNDKNYGICFVWTMGDFSRIDSLLFTKNFDQAVTAWTAPTAEKYTWDIAVECKGANLVKICDLVDKVMNGKITMTTQAINSYLMDAQLFEGVEEIEDKNNPMNIVIEASDDPLIAKLEKQKTAIYHKLRNLKQKGEDYTSLQQQFDDIKKELSDARLAVRGGVQTVLSTDKEVETLNDYFEDEERATPEERFDDMSSYIDSVIYGVKPLAVICGAPGVGKTFRIMQAVKRNGKEKDVDYGLVKGKCTAKNLFMMLHDYKKEGQLVILDDADEVFKDDVAVNLIKAACDSSDERWVSYGTSVPPLMSEEKALDCDDAVTDADGDYHYPKDFETHGGVIIITNLRAGMLDTAIKNRALLCDLDFTVDEVLNLVASIAPKIKPDVITPEAKEKALNYLRELAEKKIPMEISIRSFTLVAGMYMTNAPELAVQRRIREQMKLQSARGGKKH